MTKKDVTKRLSELSLLKAGWLDGEGEVVNLVGLKTFERLFEQYYPIEFQQPYVFPMLNGNIQLEWNMIPGVWPEMEIDLVTLQGNWLGQSHDECIIDLTVEAGWKDLVQRIGELYSRKDLK